MLDVATLHIDNLLEFSAFACERALCCSNINKINQIKSNQIKSNKLLEHFLFLFFPFVLLFAYERVLCCLIFTKYSYVPAILSVLLYEGHLRWPPWLPDHMKRKTWLNAGQIKNVTATVLRIWACLSCSHSIRIFSFQTCRGMLFVSFLCHTLTNTFRTPQRTVTQVPSCLVTCAECRHTAARFVCPTIPNIKSNVGRNGNHHIVAFCYFRWPLLCSFISVYISG